MSKNRRNFPKDEYQKLKDANRRLKSDINKLKSEIKTLQDALDRTLYFIQKDSKNIDLQSLIKGVNSDKGFEQIKKDYEKCSSCNNFSLKVIKTVDRLIKICKNCKLKTVEHVNRE